MIETMIGLLEICAKSSFYGNSQKLNDVENFLRLGWRIRVDEE